MTEDVGSEVLMDVKLTEQIQFPKRVFEETLDEAQSSKTDSFKDNKMGNPCYLCHKYEILSQQLLKTHEK